MGKWDQGANMVGFLVTTFFLVSLYPDMVERGGENREKVKGWGVEKEVGNKGAWDKKKRERILSGVPSYKETQFS